MAIAARCMMAFRRGEHSIEAEVGALLEAENLALHRALLSRR